MSRAVYIIEGDNNEEYEDNFTWIEGVFATRSAAHAYLADKLGAVKQEGTWTSVYNGETGTLDKVPTDCWADKVRDHDGYMDSYEVKKWEVRG